MKTVKEQFEFFMERAYGNREVDETQHQELKVAFNCAIISFICQIMDHAPEITDADMQQYIRDTLKEGRDFVLRNAIERTVEDVITKAFETISDPPNERGVKPAEPDSTDETQSFSA